MFNKHKQTLVNRSKKLAANPPGCTFAPELSAKPIQAASTPDGQSRFEKLYKAAEQKRQKASSKSSDVPEECTFRPATNHSSPRKTSSSDEGGGSRFDKLYNDATKIRAEVAKKKQTQADEYSFKPAITKRGARSPSPARQERFKNLSQPHASRDQHITALEKETREMEGCTFKPKLTGRAKSVTREAGCAIHDILLKKADGTKKRLLEKKKKLEQDELEQCSFKPVIHAKSPSMRQVGTPTYNLRCTAHVVSDMRCNCRLQGKIFTSVCIAPAPRKISRANSKLCENNSWRSAHSRYARCFGGNPLV